MAPSQRFTALDVFRGMTVCFMIIVNTPGNGNTTFSPLEHAAWHGFTPTDLVFPSFLFAVGNAMSFVMVKWSQMSQGQVLWKILKRTLLIFLLGYLMYWFPFVSYSDGHLALKPISDTRIMGVLQRIGLCYGIAALMVYYLSPRAIVIISVIILVGYRLVLLWFGQPGSELEMTGNAGYRLDMWIMGPKHLYHGEGRPFDPEGILSTFPAVVNVIGGYMAGRFIQQKGKSYEGLSQLLLAGLLLLALGYAWDYSFPINKKLWTSSFVLYTVGLDCLILGALIYIIGFRERTGWTYFFEVFGRNPLFIYLLSEILVIILWLISIGNMPAHKWIYEHIFSHAGAYTGSLFFALAYMLICWLVAYWLDKRKIYVRV